MSITPAVSGPQNPVVQTSTMDFEAEVARLGLTQPWEEPWWQGWDHQLLGRAFVKYKKRCIAAIDKGLGKTSWVLSIFEDPEIHCHVDGFTVIIFTGEKGMGAYIRDMKKFPEHEDKIQLIYGTKEQRRKRWLNVGKKRYIICTYASFLSDAGGRAVVKGSPQKAESIVPRWVTDGHSVDAVVCDEFHRVFRSHKSATFKLFKVLWKNTKYFIPMSGSAFDKGPQDIWPALHLCDPKTWSSYWTYVDLWCAKEVGWTGYAKIVGPKLSVVEKWRAIMRQWIFRVKAEQVSNMPPKTVSDLPVNLPEWQRKIHEDFVAQQFAETPDGDYIFVRNALERNHKLRLTLICPKALNPEWGVGQGIEDIADDAQEGGVSQYAVFTPFKAPLLHLAEYLRQRGANVWILQGGMGLDEQEIRLGEWRASLRVASPDKPSVILSTIKYAESWEIPEARYGYFLGEEYVREDNKQAEDRLRRLISVGMTYIQYCLFVGTVQEDILTGLHLKKDAEHNMFSVWTNLRASGMVQTK